MVLEIPCVQNEIFKRLKIFHFFANFWVTKMKSLRDWKTKLKAKQWLQICLHQKLESKATPLIFLIWKVCQMKLFRYWFWTHLSKNECSERWEMPFFTSLQTLKTRQSFENSLHQASFVRTFYLILLDYFY